MVATDLIKHTNEFNMLQKDGNLTELVISMCWFWDIETFDKEIKKLVESA